MQLKIKQQQVNDKFESHELGAYTMYHLIKLNKYSFY